MRLKRQPVGWITTLSLSAISFSTVVASEVKAQPRANFLPLGQPNLQETRTSNRLARGVTYTRIVRGQPSEQDFYTVDVAFLAEPQAAQDVVQKLRADGFDPRIDPVTQRSPDDPQRGPLGYLVRVGAFSAEAEANALRDRLESRGYSSLRVVYTGEDGGKTRGPWAVHVLEIVPDQFNGTVTPALATDIVPEREPLTSIATRNRALAAINGGYFVIEQADGTPGDLAGISIINGTLISEAVEGRTNFILPSTSRGRATVAQLSTRLSVVTKDGTRQLVDGLNRKPGLIRNCGGKGGDEPTERPKHDFTCTDASELILFTPAFGRATEPGEGTEAVLNATGTVIALRQSRGGEILPNSLVLSGTGEASAWLDANARPGEQLGAETRLLADGQPLPPGKKLGAVNGGPRLLRDGRLDITAFAEGFHQPENPEFYYRFGLRRNPRTLAGVTPDGKIMLIAVDGRQPGYSVGASFEESALILQALGVQDGVNLDGGGSTTMTIGPQLVNRPSDESGERPIADAILINP